MASARPVGASMPASSRPSRKLPWKGPPSRDHSRHHLQIAIAQEREKAHPITRYLFSSGFGEGWALYAERLAGEMGLYSSDFYKFGDVGWSRRFEQLA